jgi:hypothetical protein
MTLTGLWRVLSDAALLLGLLLLVPVAILLVGAPLALAVRLVVEILERL